MDDTATARAEGAPAEPGVTEVQLKDERGHPTGVTLRLGPQPDEDEPDDPHGILTQAKRFCGWSTLHVDGEPYRFSRENAVALLNRFPHFAKQAKAAGGAA